MLAQVKPQIYPNPIDVGPTLGGGGVIVVVEGGF